MIREQISQLIQDAYDGNESAAKAFAILKDLKDVIESGLKVIEPVAMQEAREFNKGEVYYGGVWEFRNTGVILDFSKDDLFNSLSEQAKERRSDLMKAWKADQEGAGFFKKDTGEEIPILPVKIPSKEILVFKSKS